MSFQTNLFLKNMDMKRIREADQNTTGVVSRKMHKVQKRTNQAKGMKQDEVKKQFRGLNIKQDAGGKKGEISDREERRQSGKRKRPKGNKHIQVIKIQMHRLMLTMFCTVA